MQSSYLFCQEIPQEFFHFFNQKLKLDYGNHWNSHSMFQLPRWQQTDKMVFGNDSLNIYYRSGIFGMSGIKKKYGVAYYGYGHFSYRSHFYGYLYPRIVNGFEMFHRFSGIPRDISRGGFNSGETDLAGIGYEILKFSSQHQNNIILKYFIKPGLWLQNITTNNPSDNQLEVSLQALKSAFGDTLPDYEGKHHIADAI